MFNLPFDNSRTGKYVFLVSTYYMKRMKHTSKMFQFNTVNAGLGSKELHIRQFFSTAYVSAKDTIIFLQNKQ